MTPDALADSTPEPTPLQIVDLPNLQPRLGAAIRSQYGPAAVFLLRASVVDGADTLHRRTDVDHVTRSGEGAAVTLMRSIGWAGLGDLIPGLTDCLEQLPITAPALDITEWAAIVVMALLIRDVESGTLEGVLPFGTSADYLVSFPPELRACDLPVEVSGVRAGDIGDSRGRLSKKTSQLLTGSEVGFVSVTTFALRGAEGASERVHSFLHCVRRDARRKRRRRSP